MIKSIRNYFKNDVERIGKCHYCKGYTEHGDLFLKRSYGDLWHSPRCYEILVCAKPKCYNKAKEDRSISMLSRKQRQYYNLVFFTILSAIVLTAIFVL